MAAKSLHKYLMIGICLLLMNVPMTQAGVKAAIAVGVGAAAASPFVLPAIGFTAAGIAAGSIGASMMSTAAVAGGGGVAAMASGGVIATLQSAATGGVVGKAIVTGAIAAVGAAAGALYKK